MKQTPSQSIQTTGEAPKPTPTAALTFALSEVPHPTPDTNPYLTLSELLPREYPELTRLILVDLPGQISLGTLKAVPLSGPEKECKAVDHNGFPIVMRYRELRISNTVALKEWLLLKEFQADDEQFMRDGVDENVFAEHPEYFEGLARRYQRYQEKRQTIPSK